MATANVDFGDLECPVCNDYFSLPKILLCGHLLCCDCLIRLLDSKPQALCPLCRSRIMTNDQRGQSSKQIADALPIELAMAGVVDKARKSDQGNNCSTHSSSRAKSMLSELQHTALPVGKGILAPQTPENLSSSRRSQCPYHENEIFKYFCSEHDSAICRLCFASKHRACGNVIDLEIKINGARKVISGLVSQLNTAETHLMRRAQIMAETQDFQLAMVAEIDSSCDRLQRAVEVCRKRLTDLAMRESEKIKVEKTRLDSKRAVLASHQKILDRSLKTDSKTNIIDIASILQTRINDLHLNDQNSEDFPVCKVTIDSDKLGRLEREIETFGKMIPDVVLPSETVSVPPSEQNDLRFHSKHGKNIKLSNNQKTAEVVKYEIWMRHFDVPSKTLLFSCNAMRENHVYEVRFEPPQGVRNMTTHTVNLGIVGHNPDTLEKAPSGLEHLSPHFLIHANDMRISQYSGNMKPVFDYFGNLMSFDLQSCRRFGVLVDSRKSLHFCINGNDEAIVASNIPQPCWAFFELKGLGTKVTWLPIRKAVGSFTCMEDLACN